MATTRKTAPAKKAATRSAPAKAKPAAPAVPAAKAAPPAKAPKAAKPKASAKPVKAEKADKAKKPKLVRDSFTIPKPEYAVIEVLKQRAARLGRPAKKSEVLRAGVMALEALSDPAFLACVNKVPAIKTGRPAKA